MIQTVHKTRSEITIRDNCCRPSFHYSVKGPHLLHSVQFELDGKVRDGGYSRCRGFGVVQGQVSGVDI